MIEQTEVKHHIQKHILSVLLHQQHARFRDMREPKTDTNLYSYHLAQLVKAGFVDKVEGGYTLGTKGLIYVDRLSIGKLFVRPQPKIVTMIVIQNGYGDVLMYRKLRQPFINKWTIPNGKVHNDDTTVAVAASREITEKVGDLNIELRHAGDCYIRTRYEDAVATTMLAHVFHGEVEDTSGIQLVGHQEWVKLREIESYESAPAIKEIIARTLFKDRFFFEEYEEAW